MSVLLLLNNAAAPPAGFTITPVSPAGGAVLTDTRPVFVVLPDSSDGTAMDIEWEWDSAADFSNPNGLKQTKTTVGNPDGVNASAQPDADLPPMSFWWRARAGDGSTWSAWTPARQVNLSLDGAGNATPANPTAALNAALSLAGSGTLVVTNPTAQLTPTIPLASDDTITWQASGHLTVPVPVDPPPLGLDDLLTVIYRRSETYPDPGPFLVDGVPDPDQWRPTVAAPVALGRPRITMNGVDISFLRGVPVEIESITDREPFGDAEMTLRFPQVTAFDARGSGDLAPLVDGAEVDAHLVDSANNVAATWFEGFVSAWEIRDGTLIAVCTGANYQLDLYTRAPGISDAPVDYGTIIPFQYNPETRPALHIAQMPHVVTGMTTQDRGAWDDGVQTTYVGRLLAKCVTADGQAWTVALDRPRRPVMRLKDVTTVHATVSYGARGVNVELQRELVQAPNVWYAEGEDEAGTRWRHGFPSDDGLGVFFQPLAYDPAVHPVDEDGNGGLVVDLGRLDTSKLRVEGYANFGQGFSPAEAARVLEGLRERQAVPPWIGTIRLDADPEECSRFELAAGQNIRVRWFDGQPSITLHIVECHKSNPGDGGMVTLTVDEAGRDASQVADLIDRLRSAGSDPVRRLIVGRDSSITKVSAVPWDTDGGSGWVPRERKFDGVSTVAVPQQQWTVVRVLAGEEETVWKTVFRTSPPAIFHVSVFDRPPAGMPPDAGYWTGALSQMPADPFIAGAWDAAKPDGLLIAWGQYGQAGGYSPGTETNPFAGLTGVIEDFSSWQITHRDVPDMERRPAFVWVAFWAHDKATNAWGRLYRGGQT